MTVPQERPPFIRALTASDRPRRHWCYSLPDDGSQVLFETVVVDGAMVAIRQVVVDADGTTHRYGADHLEDERGFLADQPIPDSAVTDGLRSISAEQFAAAWFGA